MKISKSLKRLLIVLGLVVSYAIIDFISNNDQYDQFYSSKDKPTESSANLIIKSKKNELLKKKNTLVLNWGKDPFRVPITSSVRPRKKQAKSGELKLQAITFSGENSFVMINDKILRAGEVVNGFKVLSIQENRVELSKHGKSIYLKSE
jgi:hypothetical protein